MHSFPPQVLYTVWCLTILRDTDRNVSKTTYKCFEIKKKRKKTAQIGTNVRARVFNAGLLARSQFAFGRSCDRPARARFSMVFLGRRANAELVPKFHVPLHASHAAFPMVT
jgi:hypothetical protein